MVTRKLDVMKLISLCTFYILTILFCRSQPIIIDSSFGINGVKEFIDQNPFDANSPVLITDKKDLILYAYENKLLFLDSLGNSIDLINYPNPVVLSTSYLYRIKDLELSSIKNLFIFSTELSKGKFKYLLRRVQLDNLSDSTFGNMGSLVLPNEYFYSALDKKDQLFFSVRSYDSVTLKNSIDLLRVKDEGSLFQRKLAVKTNCTTRIFTNISNIHTGYRDGHIMGYNYLCQDSFITELVKFNNDLKPDNSFGQNGILALSDFLQYRDYDITDIIEGKNEELYIFMNSNSNYKVSVIKLTQDQKIDLKFGVNGILQLDDYFLDFDTHPIYNKREDVILFFVYHSKFSYSKLFGINDQGVILPEYEINNGLTLLDQYVFQFSPFTEGSYIALIDSIDAQKNRTNRLAIIKFKRNEVLQVQQPSIESQRLKYRFTDRGIELENENHSISHVELYDLLGHRLSHSVVNNNTSTIEIILDPSVFKFLFIKTINVNGQSRCIKVLY